MTALEQIQSICSTDITRHGLHQPFTYGEYTYATDGRIIVRVPEIDGFDKIKEGQPSRESCEKFFRTVMKSGEGVALYEVAIPSIDPPEKCNECEGEGCDWCDYAGTVDRPIIRVPICGVDFNHFLLHKLAALPNVRIAPDSKQPTVPHPFIFDGGHGVIMAMRKET